MNTAIELHDSTVAEIAQINGAVIVHLQQAYLHKSEGRPGFGSGTGWVQDVRLIFAEARVNGGFPDLPCNVLDGDFVVDGERHNNLIPLPLVSTVPVKLRLIFDTIHTVTITGASVRSEFCGKSEYVEEFKP